MSVVTGGSSIQGARIGILMLETRFPRIPGDGGNAGTWPFPMLYKVIANATPDRVVVQGARGLVDDFVEGAKELVAMGADGITTNCGFLVLHQETLRKACGVPVAASSLLQVPFVQRLLPPGKRVGVMTVSAASLGPEHLRAAGADEETPVMGIEHGEELARVLIGNELELDVDKARSDMENAARGLCDANPDVGAIVFECTNMMPYAAHVAAVTGLPVYDFYTFVNWFHSGLSPRRFE